MLSLAAYFVNHTALLVREKLHILRLKWLKVFTACMHIAGNPFVVFVYAETRPAGEGGTDTKASFPQKVLGWSHAEDGCPVSAGRCAYRSCPAAECTARYTRNQAKVSSSPEALFLVLYRPYGLLHSRLKCQLWCSLVSGTECCWHEGRLHLVQWMVWAVSDFLCFRTEIHELFLTYFSLDEMEETNESILGLGEKLKKVREENSRHSQVNIACYILQDAFGDAECTVTVSIETYRSC